MRIKSPGRFVNTENQRGTTLLEFTITLGFVVFMLGAFTDCGIMIHRWMLLRHTTLEAVREASVRFVTMPVCDSGTTKAFFQDFATKRLKNSLLVNTKQGDLAWKIDWTMPSTSINAASTFPVVSITGEVPIPCFFFCQFFPRTWRLSATSESVIEGQWPDGLSCNAQNYAM